MLTFAASAKVALDESSDRRPRGSPISFPPALLLRCREAAAEKKAQFDHRHDEQGQLCVFSICERSEPEIHDAAFARPFRLRFYEPLQTLAPLRIRSP